MTRDEIDRQSKDETLDALPNFPASTPVNTEEYDPDGLGRANTEGWPRHPRPYKGS